MTNKNDLVEVVLKVEWLMPRELADAWLFLQRKRWENQMAEDSAKVMFNTITQAPGGFMPMMELTIQEPGLPDILDPRWGETR